MGQWGQVMKKLSLIGSAITLFAFSSSAFAQYDDNAVMR
jgi:hypothetical protein